MLLYLFVRCGIHFRLHVGPCVLGLALGCPLCLGPGPRVSPGALASARASVPGLRPGPCPGPPLLRLLALLWWLYTGCALHMLCGLNHLPAA